MEIALENIDILIDLNGGTLNSGGSLRAHACINLQGDKQLVLIYGYRVHPGLNLMGHKPAPVQISYIGFPVSTGAAYIDYYLADNVALPAEDRFLNEI